MVNELRTLDGSDMGARSEWWAGMLARKTGEAVWVGELLDNNVHIVHQAVPPDDTVQPLEDDNAIPWHACALGQAIVASLDDNAQELVLATPAQRMTGLTVTEPEALRQTLAMTRARGYAVEAHAATLGEAGIAAPLFDSSGRAVGAIGIVGPAERLLSDEQQDLAEAVCTTARALSQDAGSVSNGG
jgi:DNA-binding IclR family transcriptional regulator